MNAPQSLATPHRAKLRVSDFLVLAEAGAFDRYARTELIEGEIWVVNAIHRRHARAHAQLTVSLGIALKEISPRLMLYTAPSTRLADDTLPEPDIAVANESHTRTLEGSALRLAIEIADASLSIDLGLKTRLYAQHIVPEYWVVDIEHGHIRQMWHPEGDGYAMTRDIAFGMPVTAATIAGLIVDTSEL